MGRFPSIANKKQKEDQRKARIFSKLSRKISVAARDGGDDPEYNSDLANVIEEAKAQDMPKDNIERAIKKGTGDLDGVEYLNLVYEGYGPSGVAVLVEVLTDSKNRAASEMRLAFDKNGGNLGSTGCVAYMFDHKGVLIIENDDTIDDDEMMLEAIEAGAEDIEIDEDQIEIYTEISAFAKVRKKFKADGFTFEMAELRYIPQNMTTLESEEAIEQMNNLIEMLEENDDVQKVYHNWKNH